MTGLFRTALTAFILALCPMVTLVAQQEPIELPPFPDGARVAFVNVENAFRSLGDMFLKCFV